MKLTKTEAIKAVLQHKAHEDLANLYSLDMEVQINVSHGEGERIEGSYNGHNWIGYSDGITTWKNFRIPWSANSEPSYEDGPMNFDLNEHVEGIGMTGWDWRNKRSLWVAFDFDSIVGHSSKHIKTVNDSELQHVKDEARKIPWVTVRKSTSGRGLHLYVFIDSDEQINNHTEHAALARSILSQMSALTGFDFSAKVDTCGGNMWVWHKKMVGTDGLTLLKRGEPLTELPNAWRNHVEVTKGRTRRVPHKLTSQEFEELVNKKDNVRMDKYHKELVEWFYTEKKFFWWDPDASMLVTHTAHLKRAHEELGLRGVFETTSEGTNLDEQNCFAYPIADGAWTVRRYSRGTEEHSSWDQDGKGWTRCFFNREPDLRTAANTFEAVEDEKGGFNCTGEEAARVVSSLGGNITWDQNRFGHRAFRISQHKDKKRLVIQMNREQSDTPLKGWLNKNKVWQAIVTVNTAPVTVENSKNFDDQFRHMVTENGDNAGWAAFTNKWTDEPLNHIKMGLRSLGNKADEVENICGSAVLRPWTLVVEPFQPEYLGNRKWNRHAPQFRYTPSDKSKLHCPTWLSILEHVGQALDLHLKMNPWFQQNNILTGKDYLLFWLAAMVQHPFEPLPYLFFYSKEQNTGKSMFHEAVSTLLDKGMMRAENALTNSNNFNGELQGAIFCVTEELDLRKQKTAYNRIKDLTTSTHIPIRKMRMETYLTPNMSHWVQCANDILYCPIFPGDTRITIFHVEKPPKKIIPKRTMYTQLDSEASDFLALLLRMDLASSEDRLMLPIVETPDKQIACEANSTPLDLFIKEKIFDAPGECISVGEFYRVFSEYASPSDLIIWSKRKVGLTLTYEKGRLSSNPNLYLGNISFTEPKENSSEIFKCVDGVLRKEKI